MAHGLWRDLERRQSCCLSVDVASLDATPAIRSLLNSVKGRGQGKRHEGPTLPSLIRYSVRPICCLTIRTLDESGHTPPRLLG